MGFLDKVKGLAKSITGDWATVTVHVEEPAQRATSAKATVEVAVKDNAISIDAVILEVRCEEKIDIPDAEVSPRRSDDDDEKVRARSTETAVEHEVRVAARGRPAAGSSTTFTGEIPISTTAPPSFVGRHARYQWQIRARLDMRGNDPDSDWQTFDVR